MSSVDVRPVHKVADRADYLECGVGELKRGHKAAGTDRLAVMFCSTGSIEEFVERGEALAEKHGRTVQAHGYLQNFEQHEFDVNDPEELQRVNDLGYMLAQRMHPNSDVLVVTHDDSDGGHAHNHILVLNHDNETGLALKKYRTHASVKKINDELMREQGLRTVEDRQREIVLGLAPGEASRERVEEQITELVGAAGLEQRLHARVRTTQATYWATKRGELLDGEKSFDVRIGDAVTATMLDPDIRNDDDLAEALSKIQVEGAPDAKHDGITMIVDPKHGGTKFRMWNESTGRYNYRSASKLSPEFTTEGREQFFTEKNLELEKQELAAEIEAAHVEALAENNARDQAKADERRRQAEIAERVARQEELMRQREQWREQRDLAHDEQTVLFTDLDPEAQRDEANRLVHDSMPGKTFDARQAAFERLDYDELTRRIDQVKAELIAEAEVDGFIKDWATEEGQTVREFWEERGRTGTTAEDRELAAYYKAKWDAERAGNEPPEPPAFLGQSSPSAPGLVEPAVSSAPAAEPAEFRSKFRNLSGKTPAAQQTLERFAALDEVSVEILARGERLDEQEIKRLGVGQKFLVQHGHRFNPALREQLEMRAAKFAVRREEFDRGKPLHEQWSLLKAEAEKKRAARYTERGLDAFLTPQAKDVRDRLVESNRKVKRLTDEINAGVYEDTSKVKKPMTETKYDAAEYDAAIEHDDQPEMG